MFMREVNSIRRVDLIISQIEFFISHPAGADMQDKTSGVLKILKMYVKIHYNKLFQKGESTYYIAP